MVLLRTAGITTGTIIDDTCRLFVVFLVVQPGCVFLNPFVLFSANVIANLTKTQ
jgi:hypothetical protein